MTTKEPRILCGLDYILTEIEFINYRVKSKDIEKLPSDLKHLKFLVNNYL